MANSKEHGSNAKSNRAAILAVLLIIGAVVYFVFVAEDKISLKEHQEVVSEKRGETERVKSQLQNKITEITGTKDRLEQASKKIKDFQESAKQSQADLRTQKQLLMQKQLEIDDVTAQLRTEKESKSTMKMELQSRIDQSDERAMQLTRDKSSVEEQLASSRDQLAGVQDQLGICQGNPEISQLNQKLRECETKLNNIQNISQDENKESNRANRADQGNQGNRGSRGNEDEQVAVPMDNTAFHLPKADSQVPQTRTPRRGRFPVDDDKDKDDNDDYSDDSDDADYLNTPPSDDDFDDDDDVGGNFNDDDDDSHSTDDLDSSDDADDDIGDDLVVDGDIDLGDEEFHDTPDTPNADSQDISDQFVPPVQERLPQKEQVPRNLWKPVKPNLPDDSGRSRRILYGKKADNMEPVDQDDDDDQFDDNDAVDSTGGSDDDVLVPDKRIRRRKNLLS